MAYLLIANLILWAVLAAAAAAFGVYSYRKHNRSGHRSRRRGDPSRDYAQRSDWSRSKGKLNYSSFVYFDVDRDGRYGLGDRPMSGIAARLAGAKGHVLTSRTNGNGFANFTMSTARRRAHIGSPGNYQFAVSVPPGWGCTSGNEVQSREFRLIEGAPAGIGSNEMVKPVGLAPIRTLSGRAGGAAAAISVLKAGQELFSETVPADASFRLKIPDDADTVAIEGPGLTRRLALSPYPAHLGVLSDERTPVTWGAALETIDFDGVTPLGLRKIPSGYAGLNWFNLNAIARDFHGSNHGYVNGNTSGDHTCYTSSGHPAELWSDRPFGFHSVMISAAWLSSEGETAKIESWRGETLVAVDEIVVSALTPVHYAPMLKDVTRIRFSSKHCWQLVIDDLVLAR
jgi:hypothetical protein